MKKITLLLLLFLCVMLSVSMEAQTIAWSSDSEDLTGWSVNDLDEDTFNWGRYPSGFEEEGFNPGAILFSQSWSPDPEPFGTALTPDNLLFTPTFAIPSSAVTITFKMKVGSIDSNFFAEKFTVIIYDDANIEESAVEIYSETLMAGGPASAKDILANIPATFAGKTLGIVIRHHESVDQNQLLVDDFEVSYSTVLSVNDYELSNLKVYPNPIKDVVKIDANVIIDNVLITNHLGQLVLEIQKTGILNNSVDLGSSSTGFYNMTVRSENKSKTIKIIKD